MEVKNDIIADLMQPFCIAKAIQTTNQNLIDVPIEEEVHFLAQSFIHNIIYSFHSSVMVNGTEIQLL